MGRLEQFAGPKRFWRDGDAFLRGYLEATTCFQDEDRSLAASPRMRLRPHSLAGLIFVLLLAPSCPLPLWTSAVHFFLGSQSDAAEKGWRLGGISMELVQRIEMGYSAHEQLICKAVRPQEARGTYLAQNKAHRASARPDLYKTK